MVLSMLAENTQRSDGLNIVDEAQALAAVIDLRGGTCRPASSPPPSATAKDGSAPA